MARRKSTSAPAGVEALRMELLDVKRREIDLIAQRKSLVAKLDRLSDGDSVEFRTQRSYNTVVPPLKPPTGPTGWPGVASNS